MAKMAKEVAKVDKMDVNGQNSNKRHKLYNTGKTGKPRKARPKNRPRSIYQIECSSTTHHVVVGEVPTVPVYAGRITFFVVKVFGSALLQLCVSFAFDQVWLG